MSERILNTHKWILSIIKSCTRTEQLCVCNEMVGAFTRLYNPAPELVAVLSHEIQNKRMGLPL